MLRRKPAMLFLLPIVIASLSAVNCVESTTPLGDAGVTHDASVRWLLIDPANASISPGSTLTLIAIPKGHGGNALSGVTVDWSSSDPSVARVSSTGVVTGLKRGAAVVTATAGSVTTLATLEVGVSADSEDRWVSVSPATRSLVVGQSYSLASVVRDASGTVVPNVPVSYTSSDVSVATVSAAGLVLGKQPGEVVLTAIGGTSRATALADVMSSEAASITLSPTAMTLLTKETGLLAAKARDSLGNVLQSNAIAWTTSNPNVATVDDSGQVMALMPGVATVTASTGNLHQSAVVTVQQPPPASITLTPNALDVTIGARLPIVAVVRDASGSAIPNAPVTWATDNRAVATVDSKGVVTGVATGITSIVAQSGTVRSTATITVLVVPAGRVVVSPATATVAIGHTTAFTVTVRDGSGAVLTGRTVTWTSSQPNVASVSSTGQVSAIGPGVTTITATSGGAAGTATVTVPGGPSIDLAHQPSGMTLLTDRDFSRRALTPTDALDAQGWSPGESRYDDFSIISDPTAPRSPPMVAQLTYPAGKPTDPNQSFSPVTAWLLTPAGTHRLYASMWLKISANWRGHSSTANKLLEVFMANRPHVVLGLVGSGSAPLRPSIAVNGGPDKREGEYLPSNVAPSATFSRGEWHRLEMVVTVNTPGVANGQATWWMDGQLIGNYHDITWVGAGENGTVIQFELQPIWGGRNDQLTATQYLWVDHIYASTGF